MQTSVKRRDAKKIHLFVGYTKYAVTALKSILVFLAVLAFLIVLKVLAFPIVQAVPDCSHSSPSNLAVLYYIAILLCAIASPSFVSLFIGAIHQSPTKA